MEDVEAIIVITVNNENLIKILKEFGFFFHVNFCKDIALIYLLCIDKRMKRSFSVKAELHDLEKIKLYKDHYYPTDDEISRLDASQSLSKMK